MTGWGSGGWGETQWGWGAESLPAGPPIIFPLDPSDEEAGVAQRAELYVRLADDVGVGLAYLQVVVNGIIWVMGGSAVGGAVLESTPNAFNGYDIVVTPPAAYALGSRQEVMITVRDVEGETTTFIYHFQVGIGARLIQVLNPFEGVLRAYFNRAMRIDDAFLSPENWTITPISAGAVPLEVVAVEATTAQPNSALLRYAGGGSTYSLSVINVASFEGDELEDNEAEFEIVFGEEAAPQVRFFNSIFGPLGITQRLRTRRSMDDHVAGRANAFALDEQLRLRMQQLDGTAGRDGRPGKRRT